MPTRNHFARDTNTAAIASFRVVTTRLTSRKTNTMAIAVSRIDDDSMACPPMMVAQSLHAACAAARPAPTCRQLVRSRFGARRNAAHLTSAYDDRLRCLRATARARGQLYNGCRDNK